LTVYRIAFTGRGRGWLAEEIHTALARPRLPIPHAPRRTGCGCGNISKAFRIQRPVSLIRHAKILTFHAKSFGEVTTGGADCASLTQCFSPSRNRDDPPSASPASGFRSPRGPAQPAGRARLRAWAGPALPVAPGGTQAARRIRRRQAVARRLRAPRTGR
jgi:hypothetical protein